MHLFFFFGKSVSNWEQCTSLKCRMETKRGIIIRAKAVCCACVCASVCKIKREGNVLTCVFLF